MATGGDSDSEPDTVNFSEYEKMSQSTNGWQSRKLDHIKDWVATEKVHGANLSFTAQQVGGELLVRPARRTSYLREGESFFSVYHRPGFLEGEVEKVKSLYRELCRTRDILALTVYGELFGGEYPHPDVKAVGMKPVQKEVFYCPDLTFMAYDIALVKGTLEEDKSYLDYDECMGLFKSCGLFYAEPLLTGTLQQMLDYPLSFNTTIPNRLGLPPLSVDNIAEGIVVKPVKNAVMETKRGPARVIFKRKSKEFSETVATARKPKKNQTKQEPVYDAEYELVKCELMAMVTPQRLQSVISKHGRPDPVEDSPEELGQKWRKIHSSLCDDVLEDVEIDQEEMWRDFKKSHSGLLGKLKGELKRECNTLIRGYREQI